MNAIISQDDLYRYRLDRDIARGGLTVAWIMVNPSTADAVADDPTIRKVRGFSERLGAGKIIVGNLFAFRATNVSALKTWADPRGPENDDHLAGIFRDANVVIAAWGASSKLPPHLRSRWVTVTRLGESMGAQWMCFGTCGDGQPRHPLMTGYATPLTAWKRPL